MKWTPDARTQEETSDEGGGVAKSWGNVGAHCGGRQDKKKGYICCIIDDFLVILLFQVKLS